MTIAFAIALRIPEIFSRVPGNSPSRLTGVGAEIAALAAETFSDPASAAGVGPPLINCTISLSILDHFFQNLSQDEYQHHFHEQIFEQMASQ